MATKTQRTLTYNRLTGILHITDARGETGYYLDRIDCSYAPAFRLTKIVTEGVEAGAESYDVLLATEGGSCHCRGFLRYGRCRHVASLQCLLSRGSIS